MERGNVVRQCNISLDQAFGPSIKCQQFDFTLTFEQSILGIGVSFIFLLVLPLKAYRLYGSSTKIIYSPRISIVLLGIQVTSLALWIHEAFSSVAIAAAVMSLVSMSAVCGLTIFEHSRTIRPSTWIFLYLLASVAADSVQLRPLYLRRWSFSISTLASALIAGKLVLLTASVFGRSVFWWLNSLFRLGSGKILSLDDLYPLDQDLRSKSLRSRMLQAWHKHKSTKPHALLYTILSCLRHEIFLTVLPRLAMIGFSYSQSFLIPAAINYLNTPTEQRNRNHAYGLIGAAGLIYVGETLATAQYNLKLFRFQTAFRGSLVSLIYSKMLSTKSDYKEAQPVTLMTTDLEQTAQGLHHGLEVWPQIAEVGIGTGLLWRQLGPSAVAPVLLVAICTFSQGWFARKIGPKQQAAWVGAVQSRVGTASNILGSIKSIKLTNLTKAMGDLLQRERKHELNLARKFRWIMPIYQPCSWRLSCSRPFAIEASVKQTAPISTAKAFSSLAIVVLLTSPAGKLLNGFPMAMAALGCLARIQKFLLVDDYHDSRIEMASLRHLSDAEAMSRVSVVDETRHPEDAIVSVSNLTVKSDLKEGATTSSPTNFSMRRGELTLVLGPVSAGKTTLLKAVLGEISSYSGGESCIGMKSPLMGFCSQTPWIQNTTIQRTIVGPNEYDREWYLKVLWLCELEEDIANMPDGDETKTCSRGFTLSGGQRHRIALARAIYSRCPILVLDPDTRNSIAIKLFSTRGYIRRHKFTVLLAPHEESYAKYADTLLVLNQDGQPEYVGQPQKYSKFAIFKVNDNAESNDSHLKYSPISEATSTSRDTEFSKVKTKERVPKPEELKKDSKRQTGDITTWLYYAKAVGAAPLLILAALMIVTSLGSNMPKLLLKWSTEQDFPAAKFVGLFLLITLVTWSGQNAMIAQMLIFVATKSAMSLHNILVKTVLNAPLSLFETTDAGVLLNRFSQDMSMVDLAVPVSIFAVILSFSSAVTQAAFVCIGSSYMAITVPLAIGIVYFIQKFYLRTSCQMRLLQLEAKSPLYSSLRRQWRRWLNLVLGLTTSAIDVIVMALALCVPSSSSAGSLGIALTSVLGFSTALESFISSYTGAETTIGSVTRTWDLEKSTPQEDSREGDKEPSVDWPRGDMRLNNVTVSFENGKDGLRDASFHVSQGEKLGIAGRTGSGKSTLLLTLLRLIEPRAGVIRIDDQDITQLPRSTVRDRLICIPQDPLILSKSFLYNLDPEARDPSTEAITAVLKLVGLHELITSRGGLSGKVDPKTLSLGEQQLLVLAQSILRKRASGGSCILAKMKRIVDKEFRENTVITVAHSVELLRGCDTVAVLEDGKLIKFGAPGDIFDE
ncbi:P-loop containing nucleoside triphosphate hydrolase protein [Tothia fuscella]|uniref:P-loop containing nucleoside triphosphate hydrolase protein n=1 Tax=Tothia fuscella TaxID=1048955 RepID=A0A9P4NZR9_9PEZI|nr:P-loop containing nucleoside triphosphate hydrolase protein [Tothia fuscella]